MKRGEIYWAHLGDPAGNEPGYRRPVIVVQSDMFNLSGIPTVLIIPLTTNMKLAKAPGNVRLDSAETGLPSDSVANVSQIISVNKTRLDDFLCELDPGVMFMIDNGIRLAFDV